MRIAVLVLGLLAFFGVSAEAQHFCSGCGCKGGSGWRINRDDSRGKCVGCKEKAARCPQPNSCTFAGWEFAKTICATCRQHAPPGFCPLK